MNFKVAVLQANAVPRDTAENTKTVVSAMKKAAAAGADILLLPECFITGYCLPAENKDALSDGAPCISLICRTAEELGIGVVATALTKGKNKPRNSALVVGKNGEILMQYSKVHTCDFSLEACLESGTEFKVCDFCGVKLGIMICYDREYPESARILMLKGAEIILVPNDCESMKPRLNALSTRAFENMAGIAMANPNRRNAGNSCAFSPICWDENGIPVDNEIFVADEMSGGLFYADFDMDKIRAYRESEMLGNTFRKPAAYAKLLDSEISAPFIRNTGRAGGESR